MFHFYLISLGRTTNEHVTGKYRGMNFFSRGCFLNFLYLFLGPSLTPRLRTTKIIQLKNVTKKTLVGKQPKYIITTFNNNGDNNNTKKISNATSNDNIKLNNNGRKSSFESEATSEYDNNTNGHYLDRDQQLINAVKYKKSILKNNPHSSLSLSESSISSMINTIPPIDT
jgi:hypothetical protein